MRLIAQALVHLPFPLDFCASGSEVAPIEWQRGQMRLALRFPPSLSEGTCGKSVFENGWAWWTGDRIVIDADLPLTQSDNHLEALRDDVRQEMNRSLRIFLNSCRQRFHRPEIHPVVVEPADILLVLEHDDGRREALPEPEKAFFYQTLPADPPLERSINQTTLADLQRDLEEMAVPSLQEQIGLDSEWLRGIGETERAEALEKLASQLSSGAEPRGRE